MEEAEQHKISVQGVQNASWPSPYRFVRCNPRFNTDETLTLLKVEVNCYPYPVQVPWLDTYYALPSDFNLQKSDLYKTARIYGQDVSSGASVAALLSNDHDCIAPSSAVTRSPDDDRPLRVLDLCCCPGLKLCAIADSLYMHEMGGEIVGVDISDSRISVCKRVLHKYQIQPSPRPNLNEKTSIRIQVFCNDGTAFDSSEDEDLNLVFDSSIALDEISKCNKRKRLNKSARARLEKKLKFSKRIHGKELDSAESSNMKLFDRVIVDAECSTDGSVVHVQKRPCVKIPVDQESEAVFRKSYSPKSFRWSLDTSELYKLQKNLAASGFRLLRKGGYMIYSTCSLSVEENERVVQWLLEEFPEARIVPIDFFRQSIKARSTCQTNLVREGEIPGTVQFLPNLDRRVSLIDFNRLFGRGFFLAKITKIQIK